MQSEEPVESNECTGNLNEDELLKDRETRGGGWGLE